MSFRQKHSFPYSAQTLVIISLLVSLVAATVNPRKRKDGNPSSRYITIHNESKRKIDLFWIKPQDGSLGPSNTEGEGIMYGAETGIASFIGHDFEVREIGKCEEQATCRSTTFQCKKAEDQEFIIRLDENDDTKLYVHYRDARTKAMKETQHALQACQASTPQQQEHPSLEDQFEALEECLLAQIQQKVDQSQEEIAFQRTVRIDMGSRLQTYMCEDMYQGAVNLTTSNSLRNETYWHNKQSQTLFESAESQIKLYKNFLDAAECSALLEGAKGVLDDNAFDMIRKKLNAIVPAGTIPKGEHRFKSTADILAKTALLSTTPTTRNDAGQVQARLQIFCPTDDIVGGTVFFPRAGVVVVPNTKAGAGGDALLSWYHRQQRPKDNDDDEEDFLRVSTLCGVRHGSMAVVEDVYPWDSATAIDAAAQ